MTFLTSRQFVFWSEYVTDLKRDAVPVAGAERQLIAWHDTLDSDRRDKLYPLKCYFVVPYRAVASAYMEAGVDRILGWLALMRLGNFYMTRGNKTDANEVRERVANGLREILGERHPLVLKAEDDVAWQHMWAGDLVTPRAMFTKITAAYLVVSGPSDALFMAYLHQGQSEYYMNDFDAAVKSFDTAFRGYTDLRGQNFTSSLSSQMFKSFALVRTGDLESAMAILTNIYNRRGNEFPPNDGFMVMIQVAMADILRKQGRAEEAIVRFRRCPLESNAWPNTGILCIDVRLHLLILIEIRRRLRRPSRSPTICTI